jgi:hypothetical protein
LPEIEVNRGITDLEPILRPTPDRDSTDIALVFNNPRVRGAAVRCVALNQNGRPIGRIIVRIPGNGVRLTLVSDIVDGRDFIGSVRCRTTAPVIPSAFIVGSGLTDAKAQVVGNWETNSIRFPLVATF